MNMRKEYHPMENSPRGGFTITECLVAVMLLGAAMSVLVPTIKLVDRQRLAADRALICTQEASNILEQITSWKFTDITQQQAEEFLKQQEGVTRFPDADWQVTVQSLENDDAKSIQILLVNKEQGTAETELITWVYSHR